MNGPFVWRLWTRPGASRAAALHSGQQVPATEELAHVAYAVTESISRPSEVFALEVKLKAKVEAVGATA